MATVHLFQLSCISVLDVFLANPHAQINAMSATAPSRFHSPLNVFVVWHPQYPAGKVLAEAVFQCFNRNTTEPLERGAGVPVFFRSEPAQEQEEVPLPIPFGNGRYTAVLILIDPHMVVSDAWCDYLDQVVSMADASGSNHRVFPVATDNTSYNVPISRINFFRMMNIKPPGFPATLAEDLAARAKQEAELLAYQSRWLCGRLLHECCRLLYAKPRVTESGTEASAAPVRLFISHAKRDGAPLAEAIRDYIQGNSALKSFFDANDIAVGYRFPDELRSAIEESALICLQTDYYATREWCLWEVITAKKLDRPLVIVNALEKGEPRAFPYLGNVPSIRFQSQHPDPQGQLQAIVDLAMFEVLYVRYHTLVQEELQKQFILPGNIGVIGHPPELFTILRMRENSSEENPISYVLYPDPPLGHEELSLLEGIAGNMTFITPNMLPQLSNS